MTTLNRPIGAQYFNILYQVELISILYITHTNKFFCLFFCKRAHFYALYKEYWWRIDALYDSSFTANSKHSLVSMIYSKADKEWKLVFHGI